MTNDEKFKTPEERDNAFRRFCDEHLCKNECPCLKKGIDCRFMWLALEAEEEPLPCPFCGSKAEVVRPITTEGVIVRCKDCYSMSKVFDKRDEAVAVWNRRVK